MISDEDVRRFFRSQLGKPCSFGGRGSLQIFRGISGRHWKNAHPGGCARHFSVFNNFKVIPEYCFDCYKVVILPRTVVELFKLLMIFERLHLPNDNTRKCMCEGRQECPAPYKGFIYCRSIEEGEEILNLMRREVDDGIGDGIAVTLKRGCSEYAAVYPEYPKVKSGSVMMKYNQEWKIYENFVDSNSIFNPGNPDVQPVDNAAYDPAEIFAMHYWLRYAATIGDTSYLKVTNCALPAIPELKHPPFVNA